MGEYKFTMELQSDTGLGEDVFVNTFAVSTVGAASNADLTAVAGKIIDFYTVTAPDALSPLNDLFSPVISAGPYHRIRAYDVSAHLDGSPHGSPVLEIGGVDIPAPAAANPGLPSEVSVAITLETASRADAQVEVPDGPDAGSEVDRPKQRHTGRIYLPPLSTLALSVVDGVVRPHAQVRDTGRLAMLQLARQIDSLAGALPSLAVWSRKDATMRSVAFVSVDNAFDVQRRRGEEATLRTRTAV